MKHAIFTLLACLFLTAAIPAWGADAPVTVPDWMRLPVKRDRYTSFIMRFDDAKSFAADFALADPRPQTKFTALGVPGKYGKAVDCSGTGAYISYQGRSSISAIKATVQFWVRSGPKKNMWKDGRDHFLFSCPHSYGPALLKRGKDSRLVLFFPRHSYSKDFNEAVEAPADALAPDAWHHIVVSWDVEQHRSWLAVNGKVFSRKLKQELRPGLNLPLLPHHFVFFTVGGGWRHTQWQWSSGAWIDELKASNRGLPDLIALHDKDPIVEEATVLKVQDSLHRFLNLVASLQNEGGWGINYTYPPLFTTGTGARGNLRNIDGGIFKKVVGTPTGAMLFLLAHRVLGDSEYRAVAERAGSVVLRTQLPAGTWAHSYVPTIDGGFTCGRMPTRFMLQDSAQSHPCKALFFMYQETGNKAYLDAALKTAEFVLKAQNPNGSWSHSYDTRKQMGVTALGHAQGGEFNDEAIQAQMSVCAVAYHFTRDERYLKAIRRVADWLIEAQFGPPTYAWADQYDKDNNPVPARSFEAAGTSWRGSAYAVRLLNYFYDLTGDPKYLEPAFKFCNWVAQISKGRTERFFTGLYKTYDVKTGRPVLRANLESLSHRKARHYFLDNPKDLAALRASEKFMGMRAKELKPAGRMRWWYLADALGRWNARAGAKKRKMPGRFDTSAYGGIFGAYRTRLAWRETVCGKKGPEAKRALIERRCRGFVAAKKARILQAIEQQTPEGCWPASSGRGYMGLQSVWCPWRTYVIYEMLDFLEAVQYLRGETGDHIPGCAAFPHPMVGSIGQMDWRAFSDIDYYALPVFRK